MAEGVETGQITTDIPARMDRLPWARWHWLIVVGLGTVWILDGLEVTIVGAMSEALKSNDTGLGLTSSDVGLAGAVYVAGACLGALFFGQLTDRFGRKKLFMLTLGLYTGGDGAHGLLDEPDVVFHPRFFTGAGIGGEYAAINSAIDELIPAAYRGRVDVAINGSFWIGAAGGALLTIPLLDPTVIDQAYGWRLAFGLGAILGVGVLLVRRYVPESPRWLFIHGREVEGERIVATIEKTVAEETGEELSDVSERIAIRQRKTIGIGLIAKTVFTMYPRRTILCFSLFRRAGVPLQRLLLHLRRHADHVPRRRRNRLVSRRIRGQQLHRRTGAQPAVRLPRPGQDDRRHVHRVGVAARRAGFFLGSLTAVTLTAAGWSSSSSPPPVRVRPT